MKYFFKTDLDITKFINSSSFKDPFWSLSQFIKSFTSAESFSSIMPLNPFKMLFTSLMSSVLLLFLSKMLKTKWSFLTGSFWPDRDMAIINSEKETKPDLSASKARNILSMNSSHCLYGKSCLYSFAKSSLKTKPFGYIFFWI